MNERGGETIIEVVGVGVTFLTGRRKIAAVNDLSFSVVAGETFGIVGESGSGKSTVLKAIAGLVPASVGSVAIAGKTVASKRTKSERRQLQFVFQDPYGSLHPRQTVYQALREPLAIHKVGDIERRIGDGVAEVGLGREHWFRYPHQLSGGQRQRVAIARALILSPPILLLDEPTSALDVSIQAEILNLLAKLRRDRRLTSILVSHDLAVIAHVCDRVAVMQSGRLVELLDVESLRSGKVSQDYTRQLLQASRGYNRDNRAN
jgi:peptide/nickel transport system ATP-binding protein